VVERHLGKVEVTSSNLVRGLKDFLEVVKMEKEENKKENMEEVIEEEMTAEELAENNHFLLNVLIDLLIEKKVFTEEELNKKIDEFGEEEDGCDTEDKECICDKETKDKD
jgi:hypothetical protein